MLIIVKRLDSEESDMLINTDDILCVEKYDKGKWRIITKCYNPHENNYAVLWTFSNPKEILKQISNQSK